MLWGLVWNVTSGRPDSLIGSGTDQQAGSDLRAGRECLHDVVHITARRDILPPTVLLGCADL